MGTSKIITIGTWSTEEYFDVECCHVCITPERVDIIKAMQNVVLDNERLNIYSINKFDSSEHRFTDFEGKEIDVDFYMLTVSSVDFWIRSNVKYGSEQIGCDSIPIKLLDHIFDDDWDINSIEDYEEELVKRGLKNG